MKNPIEIKGLTEDEITLLIYALRNAPVGPVTKLHINELRDKIKSAILSVLSVPCAR